MSKENPFVFTRANCEVVSEFARSNSLLKQTMNSESHWNRITILNGSRYEKQMVLELVVSSVYPHSLFPCMYREDDDDTFFLFKNGFAAVMALCSRKLYVVNPETDENIELTITAQYVSAALFPLDPMNLFKEVIKKRIRNDKKLLDLRNLRGDPEMADLYCSFNCLTFWDLLLDVKKKLMPTIHGWILSHNGMTNVGVFDQMTKYEVPLLDLRYNRITKDSFRKMNRNFSIGHLLLEGNPIVTDFENAWEMVRYVKTRIRVTTLDFLNVDDDNRSNLRCFPFPSYLIEPSFKSFVDHFMFHFFKRFEKDKAERKKLALMYHEAASYSVSLCKSGSLTSSASDYLAMAIDSVDHNFICKDSAARKIKKYDNILFGKTKIGLGLTIIPDLLFAYSTFSIDVPIATDKMVQIVVNGLCRYAAHPKKYYFSKNTLLVPSNRNNGEWLVTNDLWNFTHVDMKATKSDLSQKDIFKSDRHERVKGNYAVMLNPQLKDKEILRKIIGKMTKMKPDWVERFLDESDWDLEFTLQSFTDQFKADVIPVDAFDIPEAKLQSLYPLVRALKEKQTLLGI